MYTPSPGYLEHMTLPVRLEGESPSKLPAAGLDQSSHASTAVGEALGSQRFFHLGKIAACPGRREVQIDADIATSRESKMSNCRTMFEPSIGSCLGGYDVL